MKRSDIIDEIGDRKEYHIWTIGITNDESRRKQEHIDDEDNVKYWKSWDVDSSDDAHYIEKYFLDKGMKGGSGGTDNPNCIYIF